MKLTFGLFKDSQLAGEAIAELKQKGYTKEISVLAHDREYKLPEVHEIKQDASEGAGVGATVGAVTGALAGILSGITSIIIPGIGIVVGGPLIVALGLGGGAVGALGGGILGALVDLGVNEPAAELYDRKIKSGSVLVGVSAEEDRMDEVKNILKNYGVSDMNTVSR